MILEVQNIKNKKGKVCFKENCFDVELAIALEDKRKGLMNREALNDNEGMLFIYDKEGLYKFWMKNVKISLDIIWINSDKKIVFISKNSLPCLNKPCISINPNISARYVLEIKSGLSEKMGLDIGDKLDIFLDDFGN